MEMKKEEKPRLNIGMRGGWRGEFKASIEISEISSSTQSGKRQGGCGGKM